MGLRLEDHDDETWRVRKTNSSRTHSSRRDDKGKVSTVLTPGLTNSLVLMRSTIPCLFLEFGSKLVRREFSYGG